MRASRTRQTNRTLDTITTSRTLRPFLTLAEQEHVFCFYFANQNQTNKKDCSGVEKKKTYRCSLFPCRTWRTLRTRSTGQADWTGYTSGTSLTRRTLSVCEKEHDNMQNVKDRNHVLYIQKCFKCIKNNTR